MDILIRVIWFLIALIVLVSVHEFGHFIVARWCGVKVLRFSVGFGRILFSRFDKHGTEFAFSSIPLGGYVKMLDEREMEVAPEERHLSFNTQHPWKKIAIASAGPIANLLLAILFFWIVLFFHGNWTVAPIIGELKSESLAASSGLAKGQEIVAVDGVLTPSRSDVYMALYRRIGESGDIEFTVKYPDSNLVYDSNVRVHNWLQGIRNPDVIGGLGLSFQMPPAGLKIAMVEKGSAASRAGFLEGDTIREVDGIKVENGDRWTEFVRSQPGKVIEIRVQRENSFAVLQLTPETKKKDDGTEYGYAGVSLPYPEELVRHKTYGVIEGFVSASGQVVETIDLVFMSIKKLISRELSVNNLSGPPGIAKVAADSAKAGIWAFFGFLATLSVYLGIMNLLPIPVLDGGHIVYSLVEWIKGGPIPEKIQLWGVQAGMAMLLCLVVVASFYDFFG